MRERRTNLARRITSGALAGLLVMTSTINSVGNITVYAAEREKSTAQKITYNSRADEGVQIQIFDQGSMLTSDGQLALGVRIVNNTDSDLTNGTLTWSKGADLIEAGFMGGETGDMYDDAEIPGLSASPVTEEEAASPGTKEETASPVTEEETAAPEAEKETEAEEMPFSYDEIGKATPANAEILAVVTQVPMSAALSTSPEPEPSAAAETGEADAAPSLSEPSVAAETEEADTASSEPETSTAAETEPTEMALSEPETSAAAETEATETAPSEPEPSAAAGTEPTETAPSEPEPSVAVGTEPTETAPSEPEPSVAAGTELTETAPSEPEPSVAAGTEPTETDPSETDPSETEFAGSLFSAPASDTYDHNFLSDIELAAGETYEAEFYGYIDFIMNPKNASVAFAFRGEDEDGHRVSASTEYTYSIGAAAIGSVTVTSDPLMAGEAGAIEVFTDFADLADGLMTAAEEATGSDAADTGRSLINAAKQVQYKLTTYGVTLENVRANVVTADDAGVISDITFDVPKNAELGTHYAELTALVTVNHKTYRAAEGFWFTVDGGITLTADTGTGTVTVSGPRDSFPEADTLELKAYDVETEEVEGLQDAIDKMAEEDGVCLEHIHAVSLELLADGAEAEFTGDVSVEFKGFVEKIEKAVEAEKLEGEASEEQSGVAAIDGFGNSVMENIVNLFSADGGSDESEADSEEEYSLANIGAYILSGGSLVNIGAEIKDDRATIGMSGDMPSVYILGDESALSYKAYVSLNLDRIHDGTSPWNAEQDPDDGKGKDVNDHNKFVRTFDTVTYDLYTVVNPINQDVADIGGWVYFEAELEKDPVEVRLVTDEAENWLTDVKITYYDDNNQEVPGHDLNKWGESSTAEDAYHTGIVKQVLSGYKQIDGTGRDSYSFSGKIVAEVYAAKNGDTFGPVFSAWHMADKDDPETKNTDNIGKKTGNAKNSVSKDETQVTVSAKPMYDIEVSSDGRTYGVDEADERNDLINIFKDVDVSVMLRNEDPTMGLKGIELPKGELTFDLTLYETDCSEEKYPDLYPQMWDYTENGIMYSEDGTAGVYTNDNGTYIYGHNQKDLSVHNPNLYTSSAPADAAAGRSITIPDNYKVGENAFYDGGTWTLRMEAQSQVKYAPGTLNSVKYKVTINDYDFDLNKFAFPDRYIGGSESTISKSQGYFTAAHIQVYARVPKVLKDNNGKTPGGQVKSVKLLALASNLSVQSLSGTAVNTEVIDRVAGNDPFTGDWATANRNNYYSSDTTLYDVGSFGKTVTLTQIGSDRYYLNMLTSDGNIDETDGQDAVVWQGDKLRVWARVDHQNNERNIGSINILQKFDTSVFTVLSGNIGIAWNRGGKVTIDKAGLNSGETVNYLYGVDPGCPGGWNSRTPDGLKRMNAIHEENLIYFNSLEDLENVNKERQKKNQKPYECTAVLIEARNLHFPGIPMSIVSFGIPVQVKDSAKAGETYATIESARAWGTEDNKGNKLPQPTTFEGTVCVYDANRADSLEPLKQLPDGFELGSSPGQELEGVSGSGYYDGMSPVLPVPDYKNYSYIKAKEGMLFTQRKEGEGSIGGRQWGQTILVLSCVPRVDINSDSTRVYKGGETAEFDLNVAADITKSSGDKNVDVKNTENLEVTLKPDAGLTFSGKDYFSCEGISGDRVVGEDGKVTLTNVTCYGSDGKEYTAEKIEVYVDAEGKLHIDGIPRGTTLKGLKVKAQIGSNIESGAYTVDAEIRRKPNGATEGTEQVPLTKRAGTLDSATINVTRNGDTQLSKVVDKNRIEVNDEIVYTITYKNLSGSIIDEMYLYDPLPYNGDDRESSFNGTYTVTGAAVAVVAKSRWDMIDHDGIDGVLKNTCISGYVKNPKELKLLVGYIGSETDCEDSNTTNRKKHSLITSWEKNVDGQYPVEQQMNGFKKMENDDPADITGIVNKAGAVALKIENLRPQMGVRVYVRIKTTGNNGGDVYKNQASVWIKNNKVDTFKEMNSHRVSTDVVQRGISGVVWYDWNQDGKRDEEEPLLSGVEVKLLKETGTGREQYPANRRGASLTSVKTDINGAYSFNYLDSGKYTVVFGGTELDEYSGATSYRAPGADFTINNDGKSVNNTELSTWGQYYIDNEPTENAWTIDFDDLSKVTQYNDMRPNNDLGLIATVKAEVKKEWDDVDNWDGVRPESVKVELQWDSPTDGDGTYVRYKDDGLAEAVLKAGEWKYTFDNLPKLNSNGKTIHYRVCEVSAKTPSEVLTRVGSQYNDNYVLSVFETETLPDKDDPRVAARSTITNQHIPETVRMTVEKTWENVPAYMGGSADVALYYGVNDAAQQDAVQQIFSWLEETSFSGETESVTVTFLGRKLTEKQKDFWAKKKSGWSLDGKGEAVDTGDAKNTLTWKHGTDNSSASLTWIDLPKYMPVSDNGGTQSKEIQYNIYEYILDDSGVSIPIKENGLNDLGGYTYLVKYGDGGAAGTADNEGDDNAKTVSITNTLLTAKIRLQKIIAIKDHEDDDDSYIKGHWTDYFAGQSDGEPIDGSYKFAIDLLEGTTPYTSALLGHREISGYIEVIPKADGTTTFSVNETVPMEYRWYKTTFRNYTSAGGVEAVKTLETVNGEVSVKPGDDIIITVFNEPHHDDYFHRTASVTNSGTLTDGKLTFKRLTGTDIGDTGGPDEDYTETPVEGGSQQPVTTSTPSLDGLVTDFYEKEEEWNELI